MAIPAIPAQGADWSAWAAGLDTEARTIAGKADANDSRLTDTRVPTDASVTDVKVSGTAAINADKLADGTTNKLLTAAERTKLTGVAAGATANSTDATLLARANHTGTQSADTLTDGTTNKAFLATERTKLTGVAAGATANSTDAQLRDRSTHTGTQAATTITGLATVATTGVYADLTSKPTIPTVGAAGAGAAVALSSTDTSVTNARTPTAHAASHGSAGSDPVTPAAIGAPAVFNVKSAVYGAVGNGVADDSTAIQAAVNAAISAGGGIVWFPAGNYLIGSTIQVYSASNVVFQGQGIFQNNVASAPMIRFRNSSYCGTAPTLQWIGNWKSASIALELDGSLYGDFAVRGDQWPTGINVIASASATQNSAFNDITLDIANGITGMFLQGTGGRFASNNRINRFTWGSAGSGAPIGINFASNADTNICKWAYISLNVAGAIGVIYNSASPSTNQEVYENHFEELILEGYTTGTIGIKGNLTTSFGTRASYVRYRLSGPSLPTNSIAGNSEIIFYNSTDGVNGYTTGFAVPTTTTAPSAGGAGALPATPTGYFTVSINGTPRKVPYY